MLRLMIVDDEQIIREALSQMVDYESLGYKLIATARNGMEAYDIICDEYPDVVITDIRMPFLNGLGLIERSIKSDSRITFILLSGYSEFEYAKQAMRYGVRYYLLKPTDKQELIDALTTIHQERLSAEEEKKAAQFQLLLDLHFPLEQCFIMEALEYPENFSSIFKKYQSLLSFPDNCLHACICTFVEESCLKSFAKDAARILAANEIPLQFPVIYVKNCAVLVFPAPTLTCQEKVRAAFEDLEYPGQSVTFETCFLHKSTTKALFHSILFKISRFERILLLSKGREPYEIRNSVASPWKINRLSDTLAKASDEGQAEQILDSIFTSNLPLESARSIALSLFLKLNSTAEGQPLENACDFFRKLYCCTDMADIRKLMEVVVLQKNLKTPSISASANVTLLKSYVKQHLDSENLSLKWLAENYLFVSVGYLSKQFIKEEGIRFSDYLNKKRMGEAERLMTHYHNDNVKSIARQVGFGSNPQYFSQVFKRYTGLTPTEYIEKLKYKS